VPWASGQLHAAALCQQVWPSERRHLPAQVARLQLYQRQNQGWTQQTSMLVLVLITLIGRRMDGPRYTSLPIKDTSISSTSCYLSVHPSMRPPRYVCFLREQQEPPALKRARINRKNNQTALSLAQAKGHKEIVAVLTPET